ncbi:hypothetical protein [Kutzneria buriramensis]|uniref:hypothetical protein n=1 Tax=Streptomyces sp. NL15-2K TaxID=376149 RepID=UPI000FFA016E|nr:hypothetical protein [Kutzneria buriramensis]WKX07651.1 hypothetical protein Q4V64_09210 [Kutzneria buriramensis]GCB51080.1 hypothetical protein SNL152K_8433 [Streptomyces sp. NL15-2K]
MGRSSELSGPTRALGSSRVGDPEFVDHAIVEAPGLTDHLLVWGARVQQSGLLRRAGEGVVRWGHSARTKRPRCSLAIEPAAGRLRALSPGQLLERLDDRFRMLTGGARDALPRHRTPRTAIGRSHELCAPEEWLPSSRLSVFARRFDLAAAEHHADAPRADAAWDSALDMPKPAASPTRRAGRRRAEVVLRPAGDQRA